MFWRVMGVFAGLLLVLYATFCTYLYFAQRHVLYQPGASWLVRQTPDFNLHRGSVVLRGWVLNPGRPKALLYFGGNGERIEDRRDDIARWFPDRTVYLLPYRGYAMSGGEPTEDALVHDAQALFDEAARHHTNVAVIGRSLGSGVAVQLAAHRPVERLVLVTPFDSMLRVAQTQYPFAPVRWLLKDRYESSRYAVLIRCPVLVLRADDDLLVTADRTASLVASFPITPQQVVIEGEGHNTIQDDPEYERALKSFLR
ncbi:alpha/beta hydrolase [Rhodanobacter sp. L36]|uniref:alpha/beta hydrolase n=1 Tax=Rhodanobacter sp. L36 TaxID=1747221 RepID=UPI00131B7037|nr:alpha/beta hydrolase [Rhodanobacter sp. L36]